MYLKDLSEGCMTNSSSKWLFNSIYYEVTQTMASKVLIKQILYSLLIALLLQQVASYDFPYDPEEPNTPSVIAWHYPFSVMLKMRIRYGGLQWSFHKWLLNVLQRIEHSFHATCFWNALIKCFVYTNSMHTCLYIRIFFSNTLITATEINFLVTSPVFTRSINVHLYTLQVYKAFFAWLWHIALSETKMMPNGSKQNMKTKTGIQELCCIVMNVSFLLIS